MTQNANQAKTILSLKLKQLFMLLVPVIVVVAGAFNSPNEAEFV
jgi:hypothetical protein